MEEKTSGLWPNEVFMITPQEIEHDQEHLIAWWISKDVIAPHGSFDSTYVQVITMLLDFYEKHHQKPDDNKKQV